VVRLKVSINNYTFTADFCVIDHKDIYFDFLLGLKSIADNYLFIHPMLRSLCRFTSVENFDIIAPIVENQAIEKNSCGINFIRPNKNNEENSIKEISKKKEVSSQEGKNKDLRKKDIMKSKNFNKSEKLKISNAKIPKINLDNKIKNFKIISNLKISREKARYIENPKIMEYSKNSINSGDTKDNKIYYNQNIYRNKLTNLNDNILEYINNMKNNINCNRHIQEINQNKLKKFINQLIQLKSNIIEYNNNILHNINIYILQYNERDAFMDEKHKIKDLCQLQNQLYQVFNNIILYMNKILENKIDTYINNNNYQVNAINHKDSSSNESANEIEQEQNEINTKGNKEISEFKKEVLEDHFINLNAEEYIKDRDNSRKIIMKNEFSNTTEKYATKKQNEIKIGELVKVKKFSRYKLDPYFVGPYQVVKKKFNTVQLMDPNTHTCLERPVHLKNIIKFNTTNV